MSIIALAATFAAGVIASMKADAADDNFTVWRPIGISAMASSVVLIFIVLGDLK